MERNFHGRWWLTSPVHQGDHGGAVKTIAQGMPFVSGGPCECACVFFFYCTRGCGCIEHPAFPAPSFIWVREKFLQTSGAWRRENDFCCLKIRINTFAVVPAAAPGPITTGARLNDARTTIPPTITVGGYGSRRSPGRRGDRFARIFANQRYSQAGDLRFLPIAC